MPASDELTEYLGGKSAFKVQHPGEELMIVERADVMLRVEARSFDCFLWIHAELDDVEQHLQQRLILIVSAGRRKNHERLAIF